MIALLGATGYIGRSLARVLANEGDRDLVLFARDPRRVAIPPGPVAVDVRALDLFRAESFSLVINAIGAGDPARVSAMGAEILDVTSYWDQQVLDTMGPRTRYVFLSSGAVYGAGFDRAVTADSELCLPVNHLETVPPYTIAKLYAEARHRFARGRAILDLRVFGYADRAISIDGKFLLADLARCILEGKALTTSSQDMVRDYAGVAELREMIRCWEAGGAPNLSLDLYTLAPVGKFALLEMARERFGLKVEIAKLTTASPTGAKPAYFSNFHAAADLGYRPWRGSLEVATEMLAALASRA